MASRKTRRKRIWCQICEDARERFFNFETINGFFIFIPWGIGFIYYGMPTEELLTMYPIYHERFGYNYGMVSLGLVLTIWGIRKTFVNRIKKAAKEEIMLEKVIEKKQGAI